MKTMEIPMGILRVGWIMILIEILVLGILVCFPDISACWLGSFSRS